MADDLLPSEAAELDWPRVLAVATDQGSPTHHTSILARSLGIPAVVGLVNASREVPPGALVVVDGSRGELILEPSAPMLAGFRDTQERDAPGGRGAAEHPRRAVRHAGRGEDPPPGQRGVPRTRRRPRCSTARRASACSAPSTCSGAPGGGRRRSSRSRSTAGCSSGCGRGRSPCAPGTWAPTTSPRAGRPARTPRSGSARRGSSGATPPRSGPSSAPCCGRRRKARCA